MVDILLKGESPGHARGGKRGSEANETSSMCYHLLTRSQGVSTAKVRGTTAELNGQMCCSAHRIAPGSLQGKSYFRAVLSRRREGVIHLLHLLLSSIAHLLVSHTAVNPLHHSECISQPLWSGRRGGILFKPGS